jgi:hypothetical protein
MGRPSRPACFVPAAVAALALALAAPAAAQIVINEILPDPAGVDDGFERVEIYNAGATAVDVTGWVIHDAATIDGNPAPARATLPGDFDTSVCSGNPVIQPGEFRVVKGTSTAAWLNNSGGDVVYLCSSAAIPATIVHQVTYPTAVVDQVWAALPNGTANFAWRTPSTFCASNGGAGDVIAPATVSDLLAAPGGFAGEALLTWTAPGDDGATGTATIYHIKISSAPINAGNFAAATDINFYVDEPLPKAGGAAESLYVYGLTPGNTYWFALTAEDEVPNTSGVSNSPSSSPAAGALLDPDLGYATYFGNLHSHTSYSDGVQTPTDAYNFARFTAPTPLDFLAVTDHNHSAAGMSLPSYGQGMSQAAASNSDGNFVAIYGQEWGIAAEGHVNIFESPALFGWEAGNYDVLVGQGDYAALYTAVVANPPASYPPIAMWCHPAAGDFGNQLVTPAGLSVVHLISLCNGPAFSTATDETDIGNTNFDGVFQSALQKGYRVSPTADQDNHNATWGASTEGRTGVLALAKTKSAILAALAARRNYATQDHNAVLDFSADGRPMGSAFATGSGIRIAAQVTDPDLGESVAAIDLFRGFTAGASATRIGGSVGNSTFHWRERQSFTPGAEAHYYLRIRMADNQSLWSGPVYVTYDPSIVVSVPGGGARSAVALAASPNPTAAGVTAVFSLPAAESRVSLAIYDPAGRRVRTLHDGPMGTGEHRVAWDGRGEDGAPVQIGIYFLRLDTVAGALARRIVVLR